MNDNDPETLAIAVLGWLAGQPELLGRFLALTGITADRIRFASAEPGFSAGILGFLMNHEPTLMAFCEDTGTPPQRVSSAFARLAGEQTSE